MTEEGNALVREDLSHPQGVAHWLNARLSGRAGWVSQHSVGERAPLDRRLVWACLLAAMVVAAALRLPFLGHQSLWLDEIYTRNIISAPSLSAALAYPQTTASWRMIPPGGWYRAPTIG